MAKNVDHDQRRQELLEAVWRVIEQHGVAGVTVRLVAAESGWSTGSLAHYFADKEDILTSALKLSHEQILHRWDEAQHDRDPVEGLRAFLLDNLPLDQRRRRETLLEIAYWAAAVGDPQIRDIQQAEAETVKRHLREILERGIAAGEFALAADDLDAEAERLLAFIDGVSLHMVLYDARLSAATAERMAGREVERLTGRGGTA